MKQNEIDQYRAALLADLKEIRRLSKWANKLAKRANETAQMYNWLKVWQPHDQELIAHLKESHPREYKKASDAVQRAEDAFATLPIVPSLLGMFVLHVRKFPDSKLKQIASESDPADALDSNIRAVRVATIQRLTGTPVFGRLPKARIMAGASKPAAARPIQSRP